MGKIGKTNLLRKCPREDLMMTRKEAVLFGRKFRSPQGLAL